MKKLVLMSSLSLTALAACHGSNSAQTDGTGGNPNALTAQNASQNEVIATVRGEPITFQQMKPVLMDGYGLSIMLALVQKTLAEQEAAKVGVTIAPADIANERKITLANLVRQTQQLQSTGLATTEPDEDLSPAQEEQMLNQLLAQQHISWAEFNIILEVNAYLRKMAAPRVEAHLTDEVVREKFNQMYGEKVDVRYIVCNNMTQIGEARRDLSAGKTFEEVAKVHSIDRRTAVMGGEIPPFALNDNRVPDAFKQVAFQLKPGEVSDPVQIERFIYIIKLVDKIPPAHAQFEDYRDSVRKSLYDEDVQAAIAAMRQKMGEIALDSLHIKDPVLLKQWNEKVNLKNGQIQDMNQIRKALDKEHAAAIAPSFDTTLPSDATTHASAAPPATATMPATAPAGH